MIAADNTIHLAINYAALRWLSIRLALLALWTAAALFVGYVAGVGFEGQKDYVRVLSQASEIEQRRGEIEKLNERLTKLRDQNDTWIKVCTAYWQQIAALRRQRAYLEPLMKDGSLQVRRP